MVPIDFTCCCCCCWGLSWSCASDLPVCCLNKENCISGGMGVRRSWQNFHIQLNCSFNTLGSMHLLKLSKWCLGVIVLLFQAVHLTSSFASTTGGVGGIVINTATPQKHSNSRERRREGHKHTITHIHYQHTRVSQVKRLHCAAVGKKKKKHSRLREDKSQRSRYRKPAVWADTDSTRRKGPFISCVRAHGAAVTRKGATSGLNRRGML